MNVLISGVSGGMGLATAKRYLSEGHNVYGLDLYPPKEDISNLNFIKCDITNINDVNDVFNIIKNDMDHIDILISFAGIYNLDSLIEISEEDFIKIFNINVFGVYRLNKVFLPLLNNKSRIIITSSELAPLDPLPFTGLYGITKSTLEKYAYSLRMELQLLGIKVIVIRPGAVETPLLDVSISSLNKFNDKTILYKENANTFREVINSVENKKISPNKIANLVYKVSIKKRPKYLYNINRNTYLRLLNALPQKLQNKIIKFILTRKKKKQ